MPALPSDIDYDKEAKSLTDIFLEASSRLAQAEQAESDNRARGLVAIAFRNGQQWPDDIKNDRKTDNRPTITVNHTNTFCARLKNQLRQQRPRIKCHPTGGGAKIETAEVITGVIRHIEERSNASVAYDTGVESAIDIGWGYWRIISEYCDPMSFDQELKILPIPNTFTVYEDPLSIMPAGEDRKWLLISETMSRIEYKRKYPNADNSEWQPHAAGDQSQASWDNKTTIRLAEYYRISEVEDTLLMMADGRPWLKSELPSEESMQAAQFVPMLGPDGKPISRKTTRRQVQWFRINGTKIIERRDLPGEYIPVVRCEGNVTHLNGRIIRKGMVEDLMDPARMFNYWRSAETERYALAPKAPWVGAEGQFDGHPEWDDANQRSYSRLVYKPVTGPDGVSLLPPPIRQNPAQVEAGMAQAAAGAQSDLMSVAGMQPENPEIQQRVISGNKYLQRRQGMQDLTHFQYYDKQTYAIMWTGIILLDLIPHYYDTKRMQRIIGDDGVPKIVEINAPAANDDENQEHAEAIYNVKHNLEVGRYDVVMDTGPGYQTKREEGTEALLGLLGTPLGEKIAGTSADLVVRGMDFYGADDVADRLAPTTPEGMEQVMESLPKQAKAIVMSLQQQLAEKDKLIQQQALEIKYKGQIEAARMETDLKKADMADKTKRFDTEVKSVTSRDVAEINAAAQLLNAKGESDEEEGQADKLIQKGVNK